MNIAYHELMNGSTFMIDPNKDVNEICAIILAGKQNGCVILGGGSPKNFYLQGQPTLWEVYGIPKGGNDYFIQITTDQVVWGGLSGATPAEAVSWGKVNPGVLPDTVVAYCDSTIAFPLFCEYAVGSTNGRRTRRELVHKRDELVADLLRQAKEAGRVEANRRRATRGRQASLTRGDVPRATTVRALEGSLGTLASELIPVVTRGAAPRVYADANIPCGAVGFMRTRLGWDVFFVMEHEELRRARDIEHYRLARQLGRTLVTQDRDYERDAEFPPAEGAGVIVFIAPDERRLCELLVRADRELFRVRRCAAHAARRAEDALAHRRGRDHCRCASLPLTRARCRSARSFAFLTLYSQRHLCRTCESTGTAVSRPPS